MNGLNVENNTYVKNKNKLEEINSVSKIIGLSINT